MRLILSPCKRAVLFFTLSPSLEISYQRRRKQPRKHRDTEFEHRILNRRSQRKRRTALVMRSISMELSQGDQKKKKKKPFDGVDLQVYRRLVPGLVCLPRLQGSARGEGRDAKSGSRASTRGRRGSCLALTWREQCVYSTRFLNVHPYFKAVYAFRFDLSLNGRNVQPVNRKRKDQLNCRLTWRSAATPPAEEWSPKIRNIYPVTKKCEYDHP